MLVRAWRSAARSVFSVDTVEEVASGAVPTCFSRKDEPDDYWAERIEAKAIAAEKRSLRASYSTWRANRYRARVEALAERECALRERIERRRAKDSLELEAAIQAINEGTWPEEEKNTQNEN